MMQTLEVKSSSAFPSPLPMANSCSETPASIDADISPLRTKALLKLVVPPTNITGLERNLAKWLCLEIFKIFVTILPLLEDYTCPLCTTIIWKPGKPLSNSKFILTAIVRLGCSHVFCLSCMVHLQKMRHKDCPICRENVVLQADSCTLILNGMLTPIANLDNGMMNFLKLYFPEEVSTKQKAVERRLLEQSIVYNQFKCRIC